MSEGPLATTLRPFDVVGGWTITALASLGRFGTFFVEALGALVTRPFKLRAFVDRIDYIGYRSLLIILLTGSFTGMVLGLQIYLTLVRFGSPRRSWARRWPSRSSASSARCWPRSW
jgi:phospholipid/cholesterol/gamma-HCH transport system permease protein